MADTSRTLAALLALFADNASGDISAQDARDSLVSYLSLCGPKLNITGATTATIGQMHICSGTSADYTVTLPSPTGNEDRLIGFHMWTGLTKLVTLDAGSGVAINGQQTRIMHDGESAILICDGANWYKISGLTIPFRCRMRATSSLTFSNSAQTKVPLDLTVFDPTGFMANLGTGVINIPRGGVYQLNGQIQYSNVTANGEYQTRIHKNSASGGDTLCSPTTYSIIGTYPITDAGAAEQLTASDTVWLVGFQRSGVSQDLYLTEPVNFLSVIEIPSW